MSYILSSKEFLDAYYAYEERQKCGAANSYDDFDDEYFDGSEFDLIKNIPQSLTELEYIQFYMENKCVSSEDYDIFLKTFKGKTVSSLKRKLSFGTKLSLDVDLVLGQDDSVLFVVSYSDDDISFHSQRYLYTDDRTAQHDSFQITRHEDCSSKYAYLGSLFTRNLIELYDEIGIDQITIPNPIDVGTRLWLAMGFVLQEEDWQSVRENFIEIFEKSSMKEKKKESLISQFLSKGPRVVNALARSKTKEADIFFRELSNLQDTNKNAYDPNLLGQGYVANLKCPIQRKKFDRYFKDRNLEPPKYQSADRKGNLSQKRKRRVFAA